MRNTRSISYSLALVGAFALGLVSCGKEKDVKPYQEIKIKSLKDILKDLPIEYEDNIFQGNLNGEPGYLVFTDEGYYQGFLNTNDTRFGGIMPRYDGRVAGVLLRDGTIQNPDGTRSNYTNPVKYLLETVSPLRTPDNHISTLLNKK